MFKVNDVVSYGTNGICKITGIEEKNLMGVKKNYLVLKPINGENSTCFIPVDNETLMRKIRKPLSVNEINELIDSVLDKPCEWIENERLRKEHYKKITDECDPFELIKMIKTLSLQMKEKENCGKKLHISDERFLKDAEKILYGEFQFVLNLSGDELASYISNRAENNIK